MQKADLTVAMPAERAFELFFLPAILASRSALRRKFLSERDKGQSASRSKKNHYL